MDYKKILKGVVNIINATENIDTGFADICTYISKNCPELKESEDERLRKDCIKYLDWEYQHCSFNEDKMKIEKCIAWLEKQDEHKPILDFKASDWHVSKVDGKIHNIYQSVDKDEPKFKVGDWVVFIASESIYQVEKIENYEYTLKHILGGSLCLSFSNEELIREWTIQDAKDGDVLVNGSNIFIFHFINDTRLMGYCHVNIDNGRFYDDIGKNECFCLIDAIVTPANKEQRDLLFSKMKQEGYEWDVKTKKLSKQPLKITPKFCIGQLITDDNGNWYKIKNIKCLDDWHYELYDVCEDTTHLELCSIIDERFRENRFAGEIKKMMGD